MNKTGIAAAALIAVAALTQETAWSADAGESADEDSSAVRAEVGVSGDTGRYGQRVRTTVLSTIARLEADLTSTTTASVEASYVFQSSPAGSIAGRRSVAIHRGTGKKVSTSGVGDTVAGLDQIVIEQSDSIPLEWGLSGEVKFGTADAHKGLGTGKNDYSGYTYFAHDWDAVTGRCEFGYTERGSPGSVVVNGSPEVASYGNTWSAEASVRFDLGERKTLELAYDQESSASKSVNDRAFPPLREVSAEWVTRPTRHSKFKASVLKGFGTGSPDWGGGLSFVLGF